MDLKHVREHYAGKLNRGGHTPEGVDWKDEAAQMDRLNALCLLFHGDSGFTLNDWGCGYGRLASMTKHGRYFGYDIVEQELERGEFILSDRPTKIADYTVASGLFNVMGEHSVADWQRYVNGCIKIMAELSRSRFGFNCLSDAANRRHDNLYYANPYGMARICMEYGRVSLLQYYSAWDFTILVSKC